ncbi:unnamed protein product [Penicillium camemberti]|uniref:Str. FM013 n=1 Tax=Penicillium camemberti (strain FM 013) TaxID=1429867 RepID=A0A0G4PXA0_PENC3|nr:unnamed protein product [Penicillium camemberti]
MLITERVPARSLAIARTRDMIRHLLECKEQSAYGGPTSMDMLSVS